LSLPLLVREGVLGPSFLLASWAQLGRLGLAGLLRVGEMVAHLGS
jgi:hypothetical protein